MFEPSTYNKCKLVNITLLLFGALFEIRPEPAPTTKQVE